MVRVLGGLMLAAFGFAGGSAAEGGPVRGQAEYVRYCSACHGEAADGKGPVANALNPRPPRLTSLTSKYGFPLGTKLVTYVMGTTMPRAHGTSDMPVWGRRLADEDGDDSQGVETIWAIVAYLETLQVDTNQMRKERIEGSPRNEPD